MRYHHGLVKARESEYLLLPVVVNNACMFVNDACVLDAAIEAIDVCCESDTMNIVYYWQYCSLLLIACLMDRRLQ